MSDKDFDQLFNSKLANMEVEPSAKVWSHITDELDGKQKSKGISFMRIAATIVVIMGVGLIFLRPENTRVELRASAIQANGLANRSETTTQEQIIDPGTVTGAQAEAVVKYQPKQVAVAYTKVNINTTKQTDGKPTIDNTTTNSQPENTIPKETGKQAVTTTMPETNVTALANAEPVKPSNNTDASNAITPVNTRLVTAEQIVKNDTAPVTKKKRIHSLGDLLNVVIAKVDKREDKVIEFTNSSDDDTFNVTGVNLGLIHAKKEK